MLALRERLAAELVQEWKEPDRVSVKCRDPDVYVVKAFREPRSRP